MRYVYYYCYYYSNMHLKGNQSLKQHSVSHPEQRLYFGMSGTLQKYTLFGLLEPTSSMSILCASGPNVNTYCTGPPDSPSITENYYVCDTATESFY